MAVGLTPYTPVPAPILTPARYGLYAAVTPIDAPHGMWEYGTVWDDSDNCSHGGLWQPCCSEFAGTPSVARRPIGITVTITATPQDGGGALVTVTAIDDWTGAPFPLTVAVQSLPVANVSSGGVPVEAGVVGACDANYTVAAHATGGPVTGDDAGTLVVGADCTGQIILRLQTSVAEPIGEKAFSLSTFVYGDPFVIYDGRICPDRTEAQLRASAETRLGFSEQRQVEQQFWRGPTRMHLAGPDTVVLSGTAAVPVAVSPARGIALLEGFLADHYLGTGYIHTPKHTAGLLNRELQIGYDLGVGPALKTSVGTNYVFGSGYPGDGPTGSPAVPAGHAWMYATGQVVIRRSPLVTNVTRDRTGCLTALAERTVVVAAQCGFVAGVLVDYDRCDCCNCPPTP